jgi:hypothetical protein
MRQGKLGGKEKSLKPSSQVLGQRKGGGNRDEKTSPRPPSERAKVVKERFVLLE